MKKTTIFLLAIFTSGLAFGQCVDTANIHSFMYNAKLYEVVKENKNWVDAAACAVERGGYLAEINDSLEQAVIFAELTINAGINLNSTIAPDGGGASYVWIGGNDFKIEGDWIWDGVNDSTGPQFWQGNFNGSPVGGLYNNWGNEPDNFGAGQDGLGFALSNWPYGVTGEWNDVSENNTLYYLIEYNNNIGLTEQNLQDLVFVYPNPARDFVTISNTSQNEKIQKVRLVNTIGEIENVRSTSNNGNLRIQITDLKAGLYFVEIQFNSGVSIVRKLVKR